MEKHESYDGYVIIGSLGFGKTLFLKEFERELPKTAYIWM